LDLNTSYWLKAKYETNVGCIPAVSNSGNNHHPAKFVTWKVVPKYCIINRPNISKQSQITSPLLERLLFHSKLPSTKMSELVWFVSGCSSGFGEQFAYSILKRGDKVIATGRKLEKLKHLEKIGASILQLDITNSQQNIDAKIAEAVSIYGKIDVLVNNASYVSIGTLEDLKYLIPNVRPKTLSNCSH
jgi:hypothetical protein